MIYSTCKSGSQHQIAAVKMLNHSQPRQKNCILCLLSHSYFFDFSLIWMPIPQEAEATISCKKEKVNFNTGSAWSLKTGQSCDNYGYLMFRCLHSLMNPYLTLCDGNISHYSCVCQLAVSFQMANTKIAWKNSFWNSGSKRVLLILQQIFQDIQTVHSLLT